MYLFGRAGASPPSRTTGLRCLYIYTMVYTDVYIPIRIHVPIRIHMHAAFGLRFVSQAFIMNSDVGLLKALRRGRRD